MGGQRFLVEVRTVMRRQHYSIHTERSYCDWITQYVKFHGFRSRQEVAEAGVPMVEAFLTLHPCAAAGGAGGCQPIG